MTIDEQRLKEICEQDEYDQGHHPFLGVSCHCQICDRHILIEALTEARKERDEHAVQLRKIHAALKRGSTTEDHGPTGNAQCILDHLTPSLPDPLE
jgi:hypothetical protein